MTAGFNELASQDDMARREIKNGLNECLKKYKIVLGVDVGANKLKAVEVEDRQTEECAGVVTKVQII